MSKELQSNTLTYPQGSYFRVQSVAELKKKMRTDIAEDLRVAQEYARANLPKQNACPEVLEWWEKLDKMTVDDVMNELWISCEGYLDFRVSQAEDRLEEAKKEHAEFVELCKHRYNIGGNK